MSKLLNFFFLMIAWMVSLEIKGQPQIVVLDKNKTFVAPEDHMVVMDKFTFGKLHYTAERYDTLKRQVIEYDSLLTIKENAVDSLHRNYDSMLALKSNEAKMYSDSYNEMKSMLRTEIEQKERLNVNYKKLEEKNARAKRWRNVFMGTSAIFGGILVLMVVH